MRVVLLAVYVRGADAIGLQLIEWTRLLAAEGHEVRLLVEQIGSYVPLDVLQITHEVGSAQTPCGEAWSYLQAADLVICDYPAYYQLAECLRLLSGPAIVFSYHGVTPPEWWPDPEGRAYLERSRKRAGLVHFADLAIARSHFTRRELHDLTGYPLERIHVLACVVPAPREKPSGAIQHSGAPTILSVGRVAAHKRPQLLVEALALVRRELPRARLVLAGDVRGPGHVATLVDVRAKAEALGITDAVLCTGLVEQGLLEHLYRRADLFASASAHEGFCVPAIEAMARGVPVVATASGALPETVGDAGILVPDAGAPALAAAMVELLEDVGRSQAMVEQGYQHARRFHPDVVGPQLLHLLAGLSKRPRHPGLPRLAQLIDLGTMDAAAEVGVSPPQSGGRIPLVSAMAAKLRRWLLSDQQRQSDLVLQRQVAFNREVARAVRAIDELSAELSDRQAAGYDG